MTNLWIGQDQFVSAIPVRQANRSGATTTEAFQTGAFQAGTPQHMTGQKRGGSRKINSMDHGTTSLAQAGTTIRQQAGVTL